MEMTKISPAAPRLEKASDVADTARAAVAEPLRSLDDWELVMVGGGDMTPDW